MHFVHKLTIFNPKAKCWCEPRVRDWETRIIRCIVEWNSIEDNIPICPIHVQHYSRRESLYVCVGFRFGNSKCACVAHFWIDLYKWKCIHFQRGSQSASGDKNKQTTVAPEWLAMGNGKKKERKKEKQQQQRGERRLHNKSVFVPQKHFAIVWVQLRVFCIAIGGHGFNAIEHMCIVCVATRIGRAVFICAHPCTIYVWLLFDSAWPVCSRWVKTVFSFFFTHLFFFLVRFGCVSSEYAFVFIH